MFHSCMLYGTYDDSLVLKVIAYVSRMLYGTHGDSHVLKVIDYVPQMLYVSNSLIPMCWR